MWFIENPWPPILICLGIGVIYLMAWMNNNRMLYLGVIVSMVILSGILFVVELAVVTDAEIVEGNITGVVHAFKNRDLEGTLEYFSPSAREKYGSTIRMGIDAVLIKDDVRITDVDVKLTNENTRGISVFRANAGINFRGGPQINQPSRWRLSWQKEEGEWKIIKVQPIDPLSGAEIELWF